jgi:hypothetical protein
MGVKLLYVLESLPDPLIPDFLDSQIFRSHSRILLPPAIFFQELQTTLFFIKYAHPKVNN